MYSKHNQLSDHPRRARRLGTLAGAVAALAAGAVLVVAAPAAAHVHVDGDAVPGERATVTFRVPTESDTASTTRISVTLPLDTPITAVRPQSKAGWDIEVTRVELDTPVVTGDVTIESAFASVVWTATDGGIAPGEFDEFVVQLGPIPDAAELVLPTTQDYSDGTSVEWSETATAGGAEPEHPAPVLAIGTATEDGDHGHGAEATTDSATETDAEAVPSAAAPSGTSALAVTSLTVGIIGLAVAIIAVAVAVAAVRAARKG